MRDIIGKIILSIIDKKYHKSINILRYEHSITEVIEFIEEIASDIEYDVDTEGEV